MPSNAIDTARYVMSSLLARGINSPGRAPSQANGSDGYASATVSTFETEGILCGREATGKLHIVTASLQ